MHSLGVHIFKHPTVRFMVPVATAIDSAIASDEDVPVPEMSPEATQAGKPPRSSAQGGKDLQAQVMLQMPAWLRSLRSLMEPLGSLANTAQTC